MPLCQLSTLYFSSMYLPLNEEGRVADITTAAISSVQLPQYAVYMSTGMSSFVLLIYT